MIIVDSHCHLDMLLEYDSVENLVARAKLADVHYMQTICTRIKDFENILNIAKNYPNIFASVGVHPSEVKKLITANELITLSSNKKVIGLGETGLDYFYNKEDSQYKLQISSFEQHIYASWENKLPVIIHTRNAEEDTINIISSKKKIKDFPGLIHCFTSSTEFASKMLDLGMYISISGIITFKNAEELRKTLQYIPTKRLLIETDSPYLAPVPKRGKTNEPAFIRYVLEFIAKHKNISPEELANQTTHNFFNLFNKACTNT